MAGVAASRGWRRVRPAITGCRRNSRMAAGACAGRRPGRRRGLPGGQAVQPGQVDQVIADAHLRVQAPLLGHVAERQAIGVGEQPAAPADRARIRRLDTHHDPHGRGLPGPVGAEEPEDLPGFDGERQAVQGDRPPVPPAQPGQLERARPIPAGWGAASALTEQRD